MPVQVLNSEQIGLLESHFQPRNEPNFAWKSACSAFLALPALRAFWPMSSVDYAAASQARDVAGSSYDLTNNNSADFGYDDLAPYVTFNGTNQYLSRADGGAANWADIIGTEAYVVAAQQGLTFGGWFYPTDLTNTGGMMGKWNAVSGQRSYMLRLANTPAFQAWTWDGATQDGFNSTVTPVINNWFFVVFRLIPSVAFSIYVNGTEDLFGGAVNATVQDSTEQFTIGLNSNSEYYTGRASMCFLCACALSDATRSMLFHWTRRMYGV